MMKRSYFWSRMARDIKLFCKGCLVCQKAKAKAYPGQPLEVFKDENWMPGEAVAMDVTKSYGEMENIVISC